MTLHIDENPSAWHHASYDWQTLCQFVLTGFAAAFFSLPLACKAVMRLLQQATSRVACLQNAKLRCVVISTKKSSWTLVFASLGMTRIIISVVYIFNIIQLCRLDAAWLRLPIQCLQGSRSFALPFWQMCSLLGFAVHCDWQTLNISLEGFFLSEHGQLLFESFR